MKKVNQKFSPVTDAAVKNKIVPTELPRLQDAARKGNIDDIKTLIAHGADVNEVYSGTDQLTPLMEAIQWNRNVEVIQTFINAGADVNYKNSNDDGPLIYAMRFNTDNNVVRALIDAGANVNDGGDTTPLLEAVEIEVAKMLINAGADINATNNEGRTPLMESVMSVEFFDESIEVIQELIKAGADINIIDKDGNNALDLAEKTGAPQSVIDILTHAGAKRHKL